FLFRKNPEIRSTKINSIFALLVCKKFVLKEKETGTLEVIFKNSGLVAPDDNLLHQIIPILKKLCLIFNEK
ncbi:MAG: hypothetical protein ACXVBN_03305, partial [Flavisolibacter sp.]